MKNYVLLFLLLGLFSFTTFSINPSPAFHVSVKGQGKPIIFIPGLACSGEVWSETVAELSQTYECHVLTLAGFAGQKPFADQSSFLPQVQIHLVQYIQQNLKEKPIIIGHSLGGFLAMKVGSEHPNLLHKIVVVDSYPAMAKAMNPMASQDQVTAQANMMKNMLINSGQEQFRQQQLMGMATMINDSQRVAQAVEWSVQTDRVTMAQAMYELLTSDIRDQLAQLSCPTLVLGSWFAGKNYGLTAESVHQTYAGQLAKAQDCNIKIAEKARHFIMYDEFDWFLREVTNFL